MAQKAKSPELSLDTWVDGRGIEFQDDAAEHAYQTRAKRFSDAIRFDNPDRVPVNLLSTFYPAFHYGITPETAMNDAEKLSEALQYWVEDLDLDVLSWATPLIPSAKALDIVDYEIFDWPGDGSSPKTVYQCKEEDYMAAEDYETLIRDPTDYFMRDYLPEAFGSLEAFGEIPPLPTVTGGIACIHPFILPFGLPQVQEALEDLMQAGEEALRWQQIVGGTVDEIIRSGYPQSFGGITLAPYDMLGDTVRGTRGIMMDLKRRPEVLLDALDRLTPWAIQLGIGTAMANENPHVFIPLHKGADGFMSPEEFEEFYWPHLRRLIEALVEANLIPWIFAEGGYENRLPIVNDLPEGPMVWHFQDTDMVEAREAMGESACIAGNVPTSMLNTVEPERTREYCEDLIDRVGRNGFILAPGVGLDEAKPENVRAMVESVR